MKPVTFFLFLVLSSSCGYSQSIQFSSLSFRNALSEAKQENKPLFIEIYTTWCTYCRQMERDVFTAKETGDCYNKYFINLRYDALKTDGIQIRKSYTMLGFPTFLYLNPDGLVIFKTAGFQPIKTFISNADSAVQIQTNQHH